MTSFRAQMRYYNPYELHKLIINDYVLKRPGDIRLLQRDRSKDRNDYHVLKDNHRFLWDDDEPVSWEEEFAKKYYEKLFKEYCIADLSRYKENKVALRWRIEKEVMSGKGQFSCGNKHCDDKEELRSWEVNFGYMEQGEKKNALVKIRLCPPCSKKLNHRSRKKEVKRLNKKKWLKEKCGEKSKETAKQPQRDEEKTELTEADDKQVEETPWEEHKPIETKSREEEMEEYLNDLLL